MIFLKAITKDNSKNRKLLIFHSYKKLCLICILYLLFYILHFMLDIFYYFKVFFYKNVKVSSDKDDALSILLSLRLFEYVSFCIFWPFIFHSNNPFLIGAVPMNLFVKILSLAFYIHVYHKFSMFKMMLDYISILCWCLLIYAHWQRDDRWYAICVQCRFSGWWYKKLFILEGHPSTWRCILRMVI